MLPQNIQSDVSCSALSFTSALRRTRNHQTICEAYPLGQSADFYKTIDNTDLRVFQGIPLRYKESNYRIGKLTEYYRFKDIDAVLEDLHSIKQKVLEEVELKIWQNELQAIAP